MNHGECEAQSTTPVLQIELFAILSPARTRGTQWVTFCRHLGRPPPPPQRPPRRFKVKGDLPPPPPSGILPPKARVVVDRPP